MEVNINEKFEITSEEKEIIMKYRQNQQMQTEVKKTLNIESSSREAPKVPESPPVQKRKKNIGAKIVICIACWLTYVMLTVMFKSAGYHPGGLVTGILAGIFFALAVLICQQYDRSHSTDDTKKLKTTAESIKPEETLKPKDTSTSVPKTSNQEVDTTPLLTHGQTVVLSTILTFAILAIIVAIVFSIVSAV
jgi:hypothetical protein